MVRYLLDTHILFWWTCEDHRLQRAHKTLLAGLDRLGETVGLSAISLWELAMLAQRRRIQPPAPVGLWLREIERHPRIQIYPITADVAHASIVEDENLPADPADRIIVATALWHGLSLVTVDKRIRLSGCVSVA